MPLISQAKRIRSLIYHFLCIYADYIRVWACLADNTMLALQIKNDPSSMLFKNIVLINSLLITLSSEFPL
jgi:hypothetical protein